MERSYESWYRRNFEREEEIKQGVEMSIVGVFGEKEWRIYDIWLSDAPPAKGKLLKNTLGKMSDNLNSMEGLNKDIKKISNTLVNMRAYRPSILVR